MSKIGKRGRVFRMINTILERNQKKKYDKPTCAGCKFLDYYNDGEPFCIKNISHACISSGFDMREATE